MRFRFGRITKIWPKTLVGKLLLVPILGILLSTSVVAFTGTNSSYTALAATGDPEVDTCDASGSPASWFICPIYDGMGTLSDKLLEFIVSFLKTNPVSLNPSSDPNGANGQNVTFQVWSNFRVYGNILLVIAVIVIVFGQSIGGGLLDAYTVKKVLPRILLAAILINISIYIVAFLIDITNVIGQGAGEIINAPLKNVSVSPTGFKLGLTAGLAAVVGGGFTISAALSALGGAAVIGEYLPFLLLFVVLPVVFSILFVFIILALRQALILALVLVSPVAFALYCLPNTEQYFRKWWGLLINVLMIYPIIVVIFAVANVLAYTTIVANGEGSILGYFLGFLLQFVPLFMIPYAFRLAGGVLGSAHALVTKGGKMGIGALKGDARDPNSMGNKAKLRAKGWAAENDLSPTAMATRANPTTLLGKRRRQLRQDRLGASRIAWRGAYGEQGSQQLFYDQLKEDSHVTGELAKYTSRESRQAIESEIAAYERGDLDEEGNRIGFERDGAQHKRRLAASAAADKIGRSPFMRQKALMNPNTIGYELQAGQKGWNEATGIMANLAGGRMENGKFVGGDEAAYESMMNEFQAIAKGPAGRSDLSAAVDGKNYDGYRAWTSVGMYQHGNGKPGSIKGHAEYFRGLQRRAMDNALTAEEKKAFNGSADKALDAVAVFSKELKNMGDSATGAVADAANQEYQSMLSNSRQAAGEDLQIRMQRPEVTQRARGYDREEQMRINQGLRS